MSYAVIFVIITCVGRIIYCMLGGACYLRVCRACISVGGARFASVGGANI